MVRRAISLVDPSTSIPFQSSIQRHITSSRYEPSYRLAFVLVVSIIIILQRNSVQAVPTRTHLSEANIAYFIQISESTIDHLPRLLRKLHHPNNVYAIHLDLKIPAPIAAATEQHIRSEPAYAHNVHVMPSQLITYRGVSMLLNTISAMSFLLSKGQNWHYFINLSGSDYPLLPVQTQRQLLGHRLGLNFFTFAPRRTWDRMAENRLSQVWYDESLTFRSNASIGQLSKLQVRNPLVDDRQFEVSHAEAWMIASRQFCDFVVRADMARKMLVAFAYAVDSSEHYFASLAWNHEQFKSSIVPHSLRLIVWTHDGVVSGQHPYNLDAKNADGSFVFGDVLHKSVLFFARKFEMPNSKLMDFLDERMKRNDVVSAASNHLFRKIESRSIRLQEL